MVLIEPALQTYYTEIEKEIDDSITSIMIKNNLKKEDITKIWLNTVNYLKNIYGIDLSIEKAIEITSAAHKKWNINGLIITSYELQDSSKILKEIAPDAEYLIQNLVVF